MLVIKAFKTFNINKSFYGPKHLERSAESKLRRASGATSNQVFTEV